MTTGSATARPAGRRARRPGGLENGSKQEYASSVSICAATASAISRRPWPTLQYQRLAMASINSAPSAVQSRAPSPRTTETNAGRAGLAKGWRKLSTTDENVVADGRREVAREVAPICNPRPAWTGRDDRDDRDLERPGLGGPRRRRRRRRRAPRRPRRRRAPGDRLAGRLARLARRLGMQRRWAFKHFGWPGPEGLAVLTPHRLVASRTLRAAPRSRGGTGAGGSPSAPRSIAAGDGST